MPRSVESAGKRCGRGRTIPGGAFAGLLACCGQLPVVDEPDLLTLAPDGTVLCLADAEGDATDQNAEIRPWPGLDSAAPEAIVPSRCLPEDDRPLSTLQNRERSCHSELTDPARVRVKPPLAHLPYLEIVLDVFEEPSIVCGYSPGAELYRLTRNSPLTGYSSLRLEVVGGEALLIAKAWPVDRSDETPDGSAPKRRRLAYAMGSRRLMGQDFADLRSAIDTGGFWETDYLLFERDTLPNDLVSWTLEGSRAGTYHFLQGWDGVSDVRGCGFCRYMSATLESLYGPREGGTGQVEP